MRFRRNPFRAHLQRRIFLWFGATILSTGVLVAGASRLVGGGAWGHGETERLRAFAGDVLSESWGSPEARERVVRAIHDDLGVGVILEDTRGQVLARAGEACTRPSMRIPVLRDGTALGSASVCLRGAAGPFRGRALVPVLVALIALWATSGFIARRLSRPFLLLADEAHRIARGDLSVRSPNVAERDREARVLGDVLGQMKGRIRKQLDDQRALLAAVSHEIRSPLARMRLLLEFARTGKMGALDQIESEIVEMDALVGDLLASSRIDFAAIGRGALDATQLCTEALARSGLGAELLTVDASDTAFEGDATLVSRAISNLLENAKRHGKGVVALRIHRHERSIVIDVDDLGAGLSPGEETTIFDPFSRKYKGQDAASAGLGLALVKRIAEAHGGEAHAGNRSEGGATFGFSVMAREV